MKCLGSSENLGEAREWQIGLMRLAGSFDWLVDIGVKNECR